jgi:ParB family chromosome partitioning protein
MAEARRGLGRGLGALIPDAPESTTPGTFAGSSHTSAPLGATYLEVRAADVVPNPRQPRQVFDPDALAELVHSITEVGLLQPIVVRRRHPGSEADAPFELVAGERRWRACQMAGLDAIPAIVRDTADDELLRDALLENLHRANLNPLEEAAAYQQLLADFGGTQEELARKLGRSRPQVANTMRLLKLPPQVQRRVAAGVISAGHARALLSLDNPAAMDALAERIIKEGLSVRSVEEIVLIGDDDGPRKRQQRKRHPGDVDVLSETGEIAALLSDHFDTRARVEGARTASAKGRLVIEFADLEDLRRIRDLVTH